jgi:hypothetical protein
MRQVIVVTDATAPIDANQESSTQAISLSDNEEMIFFGEVNEPNC